MQRKQIKVGDFYARTNGSRKYGNRERIKVLALDHPFERKVRLGWGPDAPVEIVTEHDLAVIKVGDDGEPKRYRYHGDAEDRISQPERLRDVKKILHTWDEEMAERGAKQSQAEQDAAIRAGQRAAAEALRGDLLSFLGQHGGEEAETIRTAEVRDDWHSKTRAYLDLGAIDGQRLLRLLNAAYQAGRVDGQSDEHGQ